MEYKENTYHKIQQYLDNELQGDELKAFESELKSDLELASEVQLNREMKEFLADTPENQLRQNLHILNRRVTKEPNGSGFSWRYLFWMLLFLLIGAFWFFNQEKSTSEVMREAPAEIQETTTKELGSTEIKEENQKPEDVHQSPKRPEATQKKPQQDAAKPLDPKTKPTEKALRPIAENFAPNPRLEFYINNNRRDNYELVVEKKQENLEVTNKDEPIDFQVVVVLKTKENLFGKNFTLHLFTNDEAAFEDFNPLDSHDLILNNFEENAYRLGIQKELNLQPGLYYYMIEDTGLEKVYFVEKFEVR